MGVTIRDRRAEYTAIRKAFQRVEKRVLHVGVFSDAKYPEDGIDRDTDYVAQAAYWNEYGEQENVPPRPFMSTTHDEFSEQIVRDVLGESAYLVPMEKSLDPAIKAAGTLLAERMSQSVAEWDTPANAERTKAKKGFDDPLVHTGRLSESLEARLRTKSQARKTTEDG